MPDDKRELDLVQRYAERLRRLEKENERSEAAEAQASPVAAQRLAEVPQAVEAPAMPEPTELQTAEELIAALDAVSTPPPGPGLGPAPIAVQAVKPPAPAATAPPAAAAKPAAHEEGARVSTRHTSYIDFKRLERMGYIVPDADKKTLLSEEFRIIKRPLIRKAFSTGAEKIRNGNIILVTSSRPDEGKTFTAINLALSMASERDLYVMLVDTDVYTQSIVGALGVNPEKGLVDLLVDETLDLSDVLIRTNIPNLTIVPAGAKHPHATELLSSQRMVRLTQDLASRYPDRIIVIDSPPILASTEPGVLASHVGQVVMVVEHNRTGWRLVERSLTHVHSCPEISFVLNKVEDFFWAEKFGAYYRSGYQDR